MASDSAELRFLANYLRSSVCAPCKRGLSEKYKMLLRTLVFGFPYVPPPPKIACCWEVQKKSQFWQFLFGDVGFRVWLLEPRLFWSEIIGSQCRRQGARRIADVSRWGFR